MAEKKYYLIEKELKSKYTIHEITDPNQYKGQLKSTYFIVSDKTPIENEIGKIEYFPYIVDKSKHNKWLCAYINEKYKKFAEKHLDWLASPTVPNKYISYGQAALAITDDYIRVVSMNKASSRKRVTIAKTLANELYNGYKDGIIFKDEYPNAYENIKKQMEGLFNTQIKEYMKGVK